MELEDLDHLGYQEHPVTKAGKELLVQLVQRENQVMLVHLVLVFLVDKGKLDYLVHQVHREGQVLLEEMVRLVHKEMQAHQALQEDKVLPFHFFVVNGLNIFIDFSTSIHLY